MSLELRKVHKTEEPASAPKLENRQQQALLFDSDGLAVHWVPLSHQFSFIQAQQDQFGQAPVKIEGNLPGTRGIDKDRGHLPSQQIWRESNGRGWDFSP